MRLVQSKIASRNMQGPFVRRLDSSVQRIANHIFKLAETTR